MWGYFKAVFDELDTKDVITLLIAVYGAVLSTFVLVQSFRKERRQVVVNRSATFYAYPDGNVGVQQTQIEVVNHGHRPVVVSAPTIRLPNGKYLNLIGADGAKDFPKHLEDGESGSICIPNEDIVRAVKREGYSGVVTLRPNCSDKTGKQYWGKKWRLDTGARR